MINTIIISSHHHFTDLQTRTIVPLIPKLYSWYGNESEWFMFVTHNTDIDFDILITLLTQYKDPHVNPYFLGHELQDIQSSIIHHFATTSDPLGYPLLCAGFVLSNALMNRLAEHWRKFDPDFTIDPVYELSQFLKYMRYPSISELHPHPPPTDKMGVTLTHVPQFCAAEKTASISLTKCSTQCQVKEHCNNDNVRRKLELSDIVFAVKTCQKYHHTRLPILWQTWAGRNPSTLRINYFSDIEDSSYNTINIGVNNTDRGHCTKLLTMLKRVAVNEEFSWLVVVDDDTLLSIPRLVDFLGCHDDKSYSIFGEMYGYKAYHTNGYLYPTGGAGIVFSKGAIDSIVNSKITCPSHDYPDDMFIGNIARLLQLQLVHSSLFHQDQPISYHPTLLASQSPPVSFHHHLPMDPVTIYNQYLKEEEEEGGKDVTHKKDEVLTRRTEL